MDTDSVYMVGNGKMGAYLCAGDIVQLFGPPYSSPSVLETVFIRTENLVRTAPSHDRRAAVWRFGFQKDGVPCAAVTDFALPDFACIVRHIESAEPLCMRVRPFQGQAGLFHYETAEPVPDGLKILLKTRNGNAVYNDYPLPFPQFYTILIRGDARAAHPDGFTYDITVQGAADVLLIGGPSYPECDAAAQQLASVPYGQMLESAHRAWKAVFDTVFAFVSVPETCADKERYERAVEDTVLNLVSQQSEEGGVLSGYAGHMAYVRDQFGVCRGLLRLGLWDRARAMLQFYVRIFRENGCILNAQAMGVRGLFHFAENDNSEITGYLLWQFLYYAHVTGDTELLRDASDLLLWLYDRQEGELLCGMMPFNGDETYIAGGLLPRDVINDGSAEATALFIQSGKALLQFMTENGQLPEARETRMRRALREAEAGYARHFTYEGKFVLNDPARAEAGGNPAYRYGVCMNLGKPGCDFFGWTRHVGNGVYLCPLCAGRHDIPPKRTARYRVPSALLMPGYMGFALSDRAESVRYVRELAEQVLTNGYFYSDAEHAKNVGYDYGLLLYNMVRLGIDGAETVCRRLLDQADATGAWSEYYLEGRPCGTRYRPWESAVNMEAILLFMQEGFEHGKICTSQDGL